MNFIEFLNESKKITIYHGDNFITSKINPKLMNNGNNQYGIGIYFGGTIDIAKTYGKNIVSIDVDKSKFVDPLGYVGDIIQINKLIKFLTILYKLNNEEMFYSISDYIEVYTPEDITDRHIVEYAKELDTEQFRNFLIDMANKFGVEDVIRIWNKIFPNIHGTYNDKDDFYAVMNTSYKVTKIK